MFESIVNFFKNLGKRELDDNSKEAAKERLHLVLMQDRANVSADFLELMKQEIIDVIKKYIDVDENEMDVRLTNKTNNDGTTGAPALYANIPIVSIKNEAKKANREIAKKAAETNSEVKEEEKNKKVKAVNEKAAKEEKKAVAKKTSETVAKKKKVEKADTDNKEIPKKMKATDILSGAEVKKVAKKMATKVTDAVNTAKSTAIKKKSTEKKQTSDEVK